MTHYIIKDALGKPASLDILEQYFGRIWRSILDRLAHDHEGYVMAIRYEREEYKIYRKLSETCETESA